jgi:hypothetical protein
MMPNHLGADDFVQWRHGAVVATEKTSGGVPVVACGGI